MIRPAGTANADPARASLGTVGGFGIMSNGRSLAAEQQT